MTNNTKGRIFNRTTIVWAIGDKIEVQPNVP